MSQVEVIANIMPMFHRAASTSRNAAASTTERLAAIRLLGYAPFESVGELLGEMLRPQSPVEIQSAALHALAGFDDPKVPDLILSQWPGFGPALRREALEAVFARKGRLVKLLDAIEAKTVLTSQIDATRSELLRKHPDFTIRDRATRLMGASVTEDRKKVIDSYRSVLDTKADLAKGRELFRKNCTACHRLENTGYEVGANLTAALRNKTREAILIDILDPSREVDSRYVNYHLTTITGRTITGIIAVETPTSLTLRRGEKAEDTILRNQIDELRSTSKSLMPDEFDKQIDKKQMADLIEYLLNAVK